MFWGFKWFSEVAWVEKPVETDLLNYWCALTIQTCHSRWCLLMGQQVSWPHQRWTGHSYFFKNWYCGSAKPTRWIDPAKFALDGGSTDELIPSPTYSIWTPLDSTGLHWIPVALLPGQIGWCNVQSSPVHWTHTGLQATFQSPVPVKWNQSTVRVQWSPVESSGVQCLTYYEL